MRKLIVVMLFFIFFLSSCSSKDQVCSGKNCFTVEVVQEHDELMKGLMFREHLDRDKGMLFIFEESGRYPF